MQAWNRPQTHNYKWQIQMNLLLIAGVIVAIALCVYLYAGK